MFIDERFRLTSSNTIPTFKRINVPSTYNPSNNETRLFRIFDKISSEIKQNNTLNAKNFLGPLNSLYLVAGGYGRDIYLNSPSNDIDIIINISFMSAFCDKVDLYCQSQPDLSYKVSRERFHMGFGAAKGSELIQITVTICNEPFEIDIRSLGRTQQLKDDYFTRDFAVNAVYFGWDSDVPFLLVSKEVFID